MSATSIPAADGASLGGLVEAGRGRRVAGRSLAGIVADLQRVPRYLVRYAVVILAAFGVLSLWEARGDGRLGVSMPLRSIDPFKNSAVHCAAKGSSDKARWQGLATALAILDEVNPQAAAWVRGRHEAGAIVFSDQYCGEAGQPGTLAKYESFHCRLIVHRAIFEECDGAVAAILCHEYRHSRQNLAKLLKCALSFVVTADGDRSILENDAMLYEHEARGAIFGRRDGE